MGCTQQNDIYVELDGIEQSTAAQWMGAISGNPVSARLSGNWQFSAGFVRVTRRAIRHPQGLRGAVLAG